jgi:hypothetical protein
LAHTDLNTLPSTHPAQKQALAELLSRFEWAADADHLGDCRRDRSGAAEVTRDMGW